MSNIDIKRHKMSYWKYIVVWRIIMASSLNLSLTNELRHFIDSRTGDDGVYATPSEYLRDLIRKDMETQSTVHHVIRGLEDMKEGRISELSILDIGAEE